MDLEADAGEDLVVTRSTDPAFDLAQHRREKIRQLEQSVEHLKTYRGKLERLLAAALIVAVGTSDCPPLALLDVLEDLDDQGLPVARLRELLDPEPVVGSPA